MQDDNRKKIGKVIAKAWTDEQYRKRLNSSPHEVLAEAGIQVPKTHKVKVVEDTADTVHVVLPARPSHMTDAQLKDDKIHPDLCKFFC